MSKPYGDIRIGEMVVYSRQLSNRRIKQIGYYMAQRWAIGKPWPLRWLPFGLGFWTWLGWEWLKARLGRD